MLRYAHGRSVRMHTLGMDLTPLQAIEEELLIQVRQAEIEFKEASDDEKEQAAEKYRQALSRFSELVLDRRFPPG